MGFLQWGTPYNERRQEELEKTIHGVFGQNDTRNVCNQAKRITARGGHVHVFCTAFQLLSWWQGLGSLTKKEEAANDEKRDEFEIKKQEAFDVEQKPLFYTVDSGLQQQNLRSKRINRTSLMKNCSFLAEGEITLGSD